MACDLYDADELEKVEQLRNRLRDMMPPEMCADTHYIIRFLRARNGDVNAAEIMLRKNIDWRKQNKIDTIFSWYKPLEVLKKYLGINSIRTCKDGSSMFFVNFDNLDIRGLLMCGKSTDAVPFICHFLETEVAFLKQQSQKLNKPVHQWNMVFNFEKIPIMYATHRPSLEILAQLIAIYEDHYPELLRHAFLINCSWYFQIGFAFVKPFITGKSLQKIKIFGKDGWKEEVLKLIDAEELPAFLGGNKTDPDGNPMCYTFINHSGLVPESYYAINNKKKFASEPGVKKVIIHRLSRKIIQIPVKDPDSTIEWEFETKNRDISVSLLYKENNNSNCEPEEIIPKNRCDTSLFTETGFFNCKKAGTYYLEFDNSYSWFYQKEVYFRFKVVPSHHNDDKIIEYNTKS